MEHWVHAAAATWSATTADDEPVLARMGPRPQAAQLWVELPRDYGEDDLPRIHFPFTWPLPGLDPTKGWVIDGIVVRMLSFSVKPRDDQVTPPESAASTSTTKKLSSTGANVCRIGFRRRLAAAGATYGLSSSPRKSTAGGRSPARFRSISA